MYAFKHKDSLKGNNIIQLTLKNFKLFRVSFV